MKEFFPTTSNFLPDWTANRYFYFSQAAQSLDFCQSCHEKPKPEHTKSVSSLWPQYEELVQMKNDFTKKMTQMDEETAHEYSPWKEASCWVVYKVGLLKVKYGIGYKI